MIDFGVFSLMTPRWAPIVDGLSPLRPVAKSRWWWWRTPQEGVPAPLHLFRVRALSERPVVTDNKRLSLVIEGRVTWPPAAPILATNLLSRQPTPPPKTFELTKQPGLRPLKNEIQEINIFCQRHHKLLSITRKKKQKNKTENETESRYTEDEKAIKWSSSGSALSSRH